MARVGKQPVQILSNVKIEQRDDFLEFTGPNGTVGVSIPDKVKVNVDLDAVTVFGDEESVDSRAKRGTIRQLINNSMLGVSTGFEKVLLLEGVGYRAQIENKKLKLSLGFSHSVDYVLPENVTVKVDNSTKIILSSCDKQLLGQTAAEIRKFRPPEPYKGKGIRYENEVVRRKVGKSGKK